MSVPKGKRKQSRFECQHNLIALRKEVTDLMIHEFGYSKAKMEKNIERYAETHKDNPNIDSIVAAMRRKNEAFTDWFVKMEKEKILNLIQKVCEEFAIGNSIFPTKGPALLDEYNQRRLHMNKAIGYCFALEQEIQYAITVLPVNMDKFTRFDEMIRKQISLIRGVRQSGNRFIKSLDKGEKGKSANS